MWSDCLARAIFRHAARRAFACDNLLVRGDKGHWTGFVAGIGDGTQYKFWIVGEGGAGHKRDPYARELTAQAPVNCVARDPRGYPWHDAGFRPPPFNDLVVYELHVGSFFVAPGGDIGTFLDVLGRIDHLTALGINAVQLMPVVEFPTSSSQGYNGTDLFSPEQRYTQQDRGRIDEYRDRVNGFLARADRPGLSSGQLRGAGNQLKALIDICHLNGLAVLFDLVLNHAGPGFDDESLYFFDRAHTGDNDNSLYFTDQGWVGGLIFAFWNVDVRQFLIDNARFMLEEYHVDGFRYDMISLAVQSSTSGWEFCQDLTSTVRFVKPEAVQIAEYWPTDPWAVTGRDGGGAGFDAAWDGDLRDALRDAVGEASWGRQAVVDIERVGQCLYRPWGYPAAWKTVRYIESHDEVRFDRGPRVAKLADGADPTSWFASSRARAAAGILLTAPGIPLLFMGQEILEATPWHPDGVPAGNQIAWQELDSGNKVRGDFLRFISELLAVRREQPALRGESINVYHASNSNRVLAYHRWLEGVGRDVVIVASLNETTHDGYRIGMPRPGGCVERFNSDVYHNWVNPSAAGNGGSVRADGPPMHGMPYSAALTIPANSLLVLTF